MPNTGRIPFVSPATSMTATPSGRTHKAAHDQFADWDRCIPYPKSAEGKATYEAAIQAWWGRNRFNGKATPVDLIPLTPGTAQAGTRECYACRRFDCNDPHFPHHSEECPVT